MRRLTRASPAPRGPRCLARTAAGSPSPHSARRSFAATAPRCTDQRRKWTTPLAKQLSEAISTTGPVPLASYMRMCLTGDVGGYYSGALLGREGGGRDQFGAKGDFVTSPEISQVFGELVGLWLVAEWISQARPSRGVQLIEVGPGRGTLMDDMLRTISRFPAMAAAIDSVFMVEASPDLREAQKTLLCGPDAPCTESRVGRHSTGKRLGTPIVWTETIKSIPIEADKMPLIVAHEFFDALPIHTFHSLALEWREMMVSPTSPAAIDSASKSGAEPLAEFQLILSSGTTRHSRYLPESSPRYRKLKQTPDAVIEICPDASLHAADFATRIGGSPKHPKPDAKGAALVLDYGTADTVPVNSLRGIRHHRLVSPFSSPGLVDLSADVDFTAIAESATRASRGVEVHGPVPQADFLELMGIRERTKMLTQGAETGAAENIDKAWRRLVDRGPNGMGKVYKALAILPENDGRRRPVGFGGDVRV
ncbi:putative s-adenosyl-L-methionine-dependent methyltransferase domain-containing protein [Hirsutella rhossiliensis]|uniref:Protein arginine methyltransferase NDUFAF7 n=1 Tax=Hirsutella rhossiliensis TaxID=111463 RepID=A0A9P8SGJ2_9HYPO|nr:putative s-adenosyl-L-methionine-dependent methyltransferase domain-containing protein [Hirsutella rhossiliensis]KAH0960545.1 putative s-adenosyl-L-methionine-dependent methyltransferase domain-containing protein [Hirsutella rhossiliensis]